ncbi:MAG: hypothetical protein WAQ08_06245 [Aquabacterium sp.]
MLSLTVTCNAHTVRYTATDLGGNWSSGTSINEQGEVVGASILAGGSV